MVPPPNQRRRRREQEQRRGAVDGGEREMRDERRREREERQRDERATLGEHPSRARPYHPRERHTERDVDWPRMPGECLGARSNASELLDLPAVAPRQQRQRDEQTGERRLVVPLLEAIVLPGVEAGDDMRRLVVDHRLSADEPQ